MPGRAEPRERTLAMCKDAPCRADTVMTSLPMLQRVTASVSRPEHSQDPLEGRDGTCQWVRYTKHWRNIPMFFFHLYEFKEAKTR